MVRLITEQVSELVEPVLEEMGFELVEVEYLSQHGRWVLRLYIDKDGGVTISDCSQVSREIGDLIDVKDMIEHEYTLEVSSPGLNRPLKRERDFIRTIGKRIKVRMINPITGRRNFTGYLKDFRDGTLYLETEEGRVAALPWMEIDKANLVYEFRNR
jgi:ribosome maturation factor RimP